ncbi:MAG: hypothetical protein ACOCWS_02350 [Alkalispirochaetaceae bacterium]
MELLPFELLYSPSHVMKREDFIFTIGFSGTRAVVDAKAKGQYGKLSTDELLERGLYRAAFCSALHTGDQDELERFRLAYVERTGQQIETTLALKRLFGIFEVPENVSKVEAI